MEYRRQRDLARQIKLQRKIDEFNEFKRSIGYTEEDEFDDEEESDDYDDEYDDDEEDEDPEEDEDE